mgnify:CR=1 FL=1
MGLLRRAIDALRHSTSTGSTGSTGATASPGWPSLPTDQAAASEEGPHAGYAAQLNGQPDPGEVVWGWVAYEDDPSQGKDRPVLLLAAYEGDWLGLMMSSQDHDRDAAEEARYGRHWMDVGTGDWDREGRPSEVRLDRLLRLTDAQIRREGAALDEDLFWTVLEAAREFHELG